MKFGSRMQNDMPITAKWSRSKPEVEFQYGGRLFFISFHFISFVSLIMPPTTRNGHTTSNHYKQKPNPKLKITKIHEMHIAHKT